ncbi:MAG TPA: hypothetical protein VK601_12365 [Kofleriaceae bacterium]|nr:hypothetical protein [Kofleriaceae bacterium]
MQGSGVALVLVAVLGGPAVAQPAEPPPAPPEPAAAPSFEQEVSAELAAQGVVLARRNLALRLVQTGDRWQASLVDANTGAVAASINVDPLPEDHGAALAAMTRAVADLADQVGRRVNQFKFRLMALRFDPTYNEEATPTHRPDRRWLVFRGGVDERLDAPEFYRMLGRDDLIAEYDHRRYLMYGGYAVGLLGFATALAFNLGTIDFNSCNGLTGSAADKCATDQDHSLAPTIAALGVGVGGALFGTWYQRHPQPIDERDARAMADAYNRQLRNQLGIPTLAGAPRLSDLKLVPYLGGRDAGIALGARF